MPWMHSLFGNAAAVATGVAAAMRVLGKRDDVRVVAQGGDGGTTDIGFGCLSGMFERNDDVLYICYDNEGYMNTGVQRSSATPPTARTATTPADRPGARQRVRHGQVRCRRSRSRTKFPMSRPRASPTCTISRPRSRRRWAFTARATSRSTCPARSAGARPRTTRSSSPASPSRPASSRSSRPRAAASRMCARSAARRRSSNT